MTKEAIEELRCQAKDYYEKAKKIWEVIGMLEANGNARKVFSIELTPPSPEAKINGYAYKKHGERKPRAGTFARKVYRYVSRHPGATPKMIMVALKSKPLPIHATLYKGKRSGYFLHNGKNDWRVKTAEPAQLQ